MSFNKQKILKGYEKIYKKRIECSVSKASNEIMLNRICEGKDIEFPFSSLVKE
tara:strand:- start:1015 stop:1173 length:159 start_codon:yes stop_codon:yes gene_type:complete